MLMAGNLQLPDVNEKMHKCDFDQHLCILIYSIEQVLSINMDQRRDLCQQHLSLLDQLLLRQEDVD